MLAFGAAFEAGTPVPHSQGQPEARALDGQWQAAGGTDSRR